MPGFVGRPWADRVACLGAQEQAVLHVLVDAEGRVVSRTELARRAGMTGLSPRRSDAVLVAVRRALGTDALQNVRGRGWRLDLSRLETHRERHRRTA